MTRTLFLPLTIVKISQNRKENTFHVEEYLQLFYKAQ